jgi:hypothetical protein
MRVHLVCSRSLVVPDFSAFFSISSLQLAVGVPGGLFLVTASPAGPDTTVPLGPWGRFLKIF